MGGNGSAADGPVMARHATLRAVEPSPWAWEPAWLEVGAVLALAAAYCLSLHGRPASRGRIALFAAGAGLLLAVLATPLETLATEYLLSAHLVQNVVLAEWAPALLVAGVAPATAGALGRRRALRHLTRPAVALPLWVAVYLAWHVPAAYDAALRHPSTLLPVEHACYLIAGLLLWWPVLQSTPWALSAGAKAGYLFGAFLLASPIGFALALVGTPIYDFYEAAPRPFDISPLRDQQLAGILMSGAEALVFFALFAHYFLRFLAEEDRAQVPPASS